MSDNENTEKIKHKCTILETKNTCRAQRKTTTKFSTMVPKTNQSDIELTQEDSQMFDTSNEDDFRSTTSHLSIDSTPSGNDIFFNVNLCQSHISKVEIEDQLVNENLMPVASNSTTMKQNIKTGSSHNILPVSKCISTEIKK